MLKVSLHKCGPNEISPRNTLGRLDIGYEKLDFLATYKTAMFMAGIGEGPSSKVVDYPRWTATIWDLVARAICLFLNGKEELLPMPYFPRGAFIEKMTAVVQHWPDGASVGRSTIGIASVTMRRTRRLYEATFEDDLLGRRRSEIFRYSPKMLSCWDLLARAYAITYAGTEALPPRPYFEFPLVTPTDDGPVVVIDALAEPARTGILRWVAKHGKKTYTAVPDVDSLCVSQDDCVDFFNEAI